MLMYGVFDFETFRSCIGIQDIDCSIIAICSDEGLTLETSSS